MQVWHHTTLYKIHYSSLNVCGDIVIIHLSTWQVLLDVLLVISETTVAAKHLAGSSKQNQTTTKL